MINRLIAVKNWKDIPDWYQYLSRFVASVYVGFRWTSYWSANEDIILCYLVESHSSNLVFTLSVFFTPSLLVKTLNWYWLLRQLTIDYRKRSLLTLNECSTVVKKGTNSEKQAYIIEHVSWQVAAIYLFQGEHWRLSSCLAHLTRLKL